MPSPGEVNTYFYSPSGVKHGCAWRYSYRRATFPDFLLLLFVKKNREKNRKKQRPKIKIEKSRTLTVDFGNKKIRTKNRKETQNQVTPPPPGKSGSSVWDKKLFDNNGPLPAKAVGSRGLQGLQRLLEVRHSHLPLFLSVRVVADSCFDTRSKDSRRKREKKQ